MDTSLGQHRARLLLLRSWNATGSTFNNRVRDLSNTALVHMAGDIPQALVPDSETIVLRAPIDSADTTVDALLEATADRWVLRFTDNAGGALAGAASGTTWRPALDGTWDASMHLEVQYDSTNDLWARRQAREWWQSGDEIYVSLDRRWRNTIDTSMAFRIYQPAFVLPADVMEVLKPARIWDETKQNLWAIDTGGAYRQSMIDFRRESAARPYRMFRGSHIQLPAPTSAPTVALINGPNWAAAADVQEGTFTFRYTYVWGRRDAEWREGPDSGIADPFYESAPSPESSSVAHTALDETIRISPTNIDVMQNFDVTGTLREAHSGYRIRIYVARTAVRTAGTGHAGTDQVETDGRYYLLTEIEPTTLNYSWNGTTVPDYHRPLVHSTGYYHWHVWPPQDARYELDFRVLRLPKPLVADADTIPLQRDAVPAFTQLCLYYMCLMDGVDLANAEQHLNHYQQWVKIARGRYANPAGIVEPQPFGGFRTRSSFGTYSDE